MRDWLTQGDLLYILLTLDDARKALYKYGADQKLLTRMAAAMIRCSMRTDNDRVKKIGSTRRAKIWRTKGTKCIRAVSGLHKKGSGS